MKTEQEGSIWIWLDTDNQTEWPTGDISVKGNSGTTTPADSCVINTAVTVIDRIVMGPLGTAGTLTFFKHDGTTEICQRTMATPSNTNLSSWHMPCGFRIFGPWSVNANVTGATCDVYVEFHYDKTWTS